MDTSEHLSQTAFGADLSRVVGTRADAGRGLFGLVPEGWGLSDGWAFWLIMLATALVWWGLYRAWDPAADGEGRWPRLRRIAVQYFPPFWIVVLLSSLGAQDWVEGWMEQWTLPGTILAVVALASASAWSIRELWSRKGLARGHDFALQAWVLVVIPLLAVAVVVSEIPDESTRGQVITFFGVVVGAVFTLSSTSFASNAIAGVMLRSARTYKPGDWIRVEDQFGRITQRGLVHTEIETDSSDLTSIPNLYLVTKPYTVVPASGTVVSAQVSLGYDVPHWEVEPILKKAAEAVGLESPFCQVLELGDVTVTYRAAGMLRDVRWLLTHRSRLHREVLAGLHEAGIEIMSPSVVGHRAIPSDRLVAPDRPRPPDGAEPDDLSEPVIFEKTEAVEKVEEGRQGIARLQAEIAQLRNELEAVADAAERERLVERVATLERRRERAARALAEREQREQEFNPTEEN